MRAREYRFGDLASPCISFTFFSGTLKHPLMIELLMRADGSPPIASPWKQAGHRSWDSKGFLGRGRQVQDSGC